MLKRLLLVVSTLLIVLGLCDEAAQAQIAIPASGYISTIAGGGASGQWYAGEGGAATSATLESIMGNVAIDAEGNVYIADEFSDCIYKVNKQTGVIKTVVGKCLSSSNRSVNYTIATDGDSGLATNAWLFHPYGVAIDQSGNLYVADSMVHAVRKVDSSTGIITTIIGNGTACSAPKNVCGDGGPALSAELNSPTHVAVDPSGNVYVIDNGDNRIRKLTVSTGIITTIAGTGVGACCTTGRLATSVPIADITGIAVDSAENVYLTTDYSGQYFVFKITASTGMLSAIAGTGTATTSGDGGPAISAAVNKPEGIWVDSYENIYFTQTDTEEGNYGNGVRMISAATGNISSVAGGATLGTSGDGGLATNAKFYGPAGVTVDGAGNIYVSDKSRVRAIGALSVPTTTTVSTSDSNIYYGAKVTFTATVTATSGTPTGTVTFYSDGTSIGTGTLSSGSASITNSTLAIGTHSITASYAANGSYLASTSEAITQDITKVPSSLNVSMSPNPSTVTSAVTIATTAAASNGGTPDGTLAITSDGSSIGNLTLSGGSASMSTSSLAVGAHSITVTYAGTSTYDSSSVTNTQTVNQIGTTTAVTASSSSARFGSCTTFQATVTANQSTATGTVAFTANSTSLSSAALSNGVASVSSCSLAVGTYTITASYGGTTNFATSSGATTYSVTKQTPYITWTTPAAITYGTPLSATQLNATSSVAGSFVYSPAAGTVLTAGTHTLSVAFTPADTANYSSASATVSLTVNQAKPTITWATPASITYGTALSATQLNATSTVAGSFVYSPAAGTVLTAGSHTLSVAFTPTDTTDYSSASATVTLTVNQAKPTITWATPASITYGTALSATQLNATSAVAGSFVYSPAAGTVLTAGTHILSVTLTPTDTTDYSSASATVSLTVTPATPTITWATPASITYGTALSATQLNATSTVAGSFVYTPAAGSVLAPGSNLLSVTFTPTDTVDYIASQATVTLLVTKAAVTITGVSSLSPSFFGDEVTWTFTAAASGSGVTPTGKLTITDGTTALSTVTLVDGVATYASSVFDAGSHILTATYSGDSDYE